MAFRLIATLVLALLVAACADEPAPTSTAPTPASDSAVAVLRTMDRTAFDSAYVRIARHAFTRLTRTEQLSDDVVVAYVEHRTHFGGGGDARVVTVDSVGAFEFGTLGQLIDATVTPATPANLSQHVLPEDPAFLSARNRAAYRYRLLPDTLWFDQPAHVVDVQVRPGGATRQSIRRARLYVTHADSQLVGLDLTHTEDTWLYDESSRFVVRLRPDADGGWLPSTTRVLTTTDLPFGEPRTFNATSTYRTGQTASLP